MMAFCMFSARSLLSHMVRGSVPCRWCVCHIIVTLAIAVALLVLVLVLLLLPCRWCVCHIIGTVAVVSG